MTVTRTDLIDRNGDRMTRVSFPNTAYESFAEAPRQMIGVHFGPTEFAEMSRAKSPKLRLFAEQAGFGKARRHAEDDGDRDALVAQLRKAGAQDAIIQKCDTPALAEWCRLLDSLGGGAEEYDEQGPHGPTSGDGMPGAGGRRREIEEGQNRPGVPTS